ncbi:hypothetical protein XHV734_1107 [Xanthomonas hortorum pv. vitians]|nr:hypothetical protein XHV734_1107 [Xanthomonas hortorum pv. vitians]
MTAWPTHRVECNSHCRRKYEFSIAPADEWASHRAAEVYTSPAFSAVNDSVQNIRLVP